MHHFRRHRHHPGQRQRPPGFAHRRRRLLDGACLLRFRRETQGANRRQHLRQPIFSVADGEHTLQQIELQPGYRRQPAERIANQALLSRAIHLFDMDARGKRTGQRLVHRLSGSAGVIIPVVVVGMIVPGRCLFVRVVAATAHGNLPEGDIAQYTP